MTKVGSPCASYTTRPFICGDLRPWVFLGQWIIEKWTRPVCTAFWALCSLFWCWGWFFPPGTEKGTFGRRFISCQQGDVYGSACLNSGGFQVVVIHNNPGDQLTYIQCQVYSPSWYRVEYSWGEWASLCGSWLDREASVFHCRIWYWCVCFGNCHYFIDSISSASIFKMFWG